MNTNTEKSRRRIGWALLLILAQTLFMGLGQGGISLLLPEGTSVFTPTWQGVVFLLVVGPFTAWLLVARGAVRRGGVSWSELGWRRERWGAAVLLGAVAFPFAALLSFAPAVWSGAVTSRELLDAVLSWSWSDRCFFALIGLTAAFNEESLFRGLLQPALAERLGAASIVLTALLFAVYHLNPHPLALLGKVGVGLVYGALRWRDRSLVAPATAHVLMWLVVGAV
jgi:membrane protease YdiL (CAAX protease family)